MPRLNEYRRREIPRNGGIAHSSPELVLDHDFVAPREEDRTERRTIDTIFGPDLEKLLLTLSAGDTDR